MLKLSEISTGAKGVSATGVETLPGLLSRNTNSLQLRLSYTHTHITDLCMYTVLFQDQIWEWDCDYDITVHEVVTTAYLTNGFLERAMDEMTLAMRRHDCCKLW